MRVEMNNEDIEEKSKHGTAGFPIEIYHPKGLMVPYHWHAEHEFLYMNSGKANCRAGSEVFELCAGECAYFTGGALHSLFTEDCEVIDFYAIVFNPSLLFS